MKNARAGESVRMVRAMLAGAAFLVGACSSSSASPEPRSDSGPTPDATHGADARARKDAGARDGGRGPEAGKDAAPRGDASDASSDADAAPADAFVGEKCTVTFSVGTSTSDTNCELSVVALTASSWEVVASGIGFGTDVIPGTSDTWEGISVYLTGSPAVGSYPASVVVGGGSRVLGSTEAGTGLVYWYYDPGPDSGTLFGSASLDLTALGPVSLADGGTTYPTAHGTVTGTLAAVGSDASPGVTYTITF